MQSAQSQKKKIEEEYKAEIKRTIRPKSHSKQLDFLTQNHLIIQHDGHLYMYVYTLFYSFYFPFSVS